jgi:condensin complex subunit 3
VHILADILSTHPTLFSSPTDSGLPKSILKIFSKALKAVSTPNVQSAATTALCKLMLTSVIQDEDLLKQAVICYFDPATKDNAAMRQALSYFLPVYCHSRLENMKRMAAIALGVLHALLNLGEELDEGEEMVGISVVGTMLVDWTDARKLVVQDAAAVSWDEAGRKEVKAVNGDVHLDLAAELLDRAMSNGCTSKLLLCLALFPIRTGNIQHGH